MLERIEKELSKGLPTGAVSKRKQGGFAVSYIEGHYSIETANRIFGFDGWNMAVKSMDIHETDKGFEAVAIVQIKVDCGEPGEWIVRTDVGTGDSSKKMGRDKAVKEAVTDAMKRCFRTFGNQFGNSLYDKENPVHKGKKDSHQEKEELSHDDGGKIMQQFLHDLVNTHKLPEWSQVCAFYADDIGRLPEDEKVKMRLAALDRKEHIEKTTEKEGE